MPLLRRHRGLYARRSGRYSPLRQPRRQDRNNRPPGRIPDRTDPRRPPRRLDRKLRRPGRLPTPKGQAMTLPEIVSPEEWQKARDELLAKEKEHMKAADHLGAERRRLPMVRFDAKYEFESADG